jgi:CRISPR system Cascade subunit CasA
MDHDLTVEPLLSWRNHARHRDRATLPGILSRLASGELEDFPRVRAHQFHPWSMFLTQLAAIALRRAGLTDPCQSEDAWRELLLALTGREHEPWCLVVEDLARPAFLQPPVPEGSLAGWRTRAHPDDIDILVTAKAHDVKMSTIASDDLEAWIYALVTLQTMQGFPGRGYTRVARMNGGYGNRARVGYAPDPSPAGRFRRDVEVLLASWDTLVESRGFRNDGISLVWTEPWDGKASIALTALSPHFIEVCWRVRFPPGGVAACAYTTTSERRCAPEVDDGDVGDSWIPVARTGGALTVGSRGFGYDLLSRVLFSDEYAQAAAQQLTASDGDPIVFVASATARGQGKTEGLHERVLPLSGRVRWQMGRPDGRAALGRRASVWIQCADKMRSRVLFPALKRIALGEHVVEDRFSERVDEGFFERLFSTLDDPEAAARLAFEAWTSQVAWDELQTAIDRCAVPDAQRLRLVSDAERTFAACLRKNFEDLAQAEAARTGERS